MSDMFCGCSSLSSLPDISQWNTKNVINMNSMFFNCSSLLSLPDISKWNTNNVIDMNGMFRNCKSLSSLPDISKWNTFNVIDMHNCGSLMSLPENLYSKNIIYIKSSIIIKIYKSKLNAGNVIINNS